MLIVERVAFQCVIKQGLRTLQLSGSRKCKSDYGLLMNILTRIVNTLSGQSFGRSACNHTLYIQFSSVFLLQAAHKIAVSYLKKLLRKC